MVCQICGTGLVGDTVWCARCGTPHHRDCVDFVSRCAVFGCGSRSFQAERPAGLPEPEAAAPTFEVLARPRGLVGRLVASARLLIANPGITGILFLACYLPIELGLWRSSALLGEMVANLAEALLVILFAARARGKELRVGQVLTLLRERGPRVVVVGTVITYLVEYPISMMVLSMTMGRWNDMWATAGPLLLFPWVLVQALTCLAVIITAMGREEEPGNPFRRSGDLAVRAFFQVLIALVLFRASGMMYVQLLIRLFGFEMGGLVEHAMQAGLCLMHLFFSAHWLLFYLERRQFEHLERQRELDEFARQRGGAAPGA